MPTCNAVKDASAILLCISAVLINPYKPFVGLILVASGRNTPLASQGIKGICKRFV